MKCDECGVESRPDFDFATIRNGPTKKRFICPTCLQFKRHESGNTIIKDFFGGLFFASLFLLNEKAPWFFLNIYLFLAMVYLSIVPHELGHALGVLLTRSKLLEISFGQGRRLYYTKLFGVYLDFCIAPIEGRVRYLHQKGYALRFKSIFISVMGPATNLILFLILWFMFEDAIANESFYKTPAPMFTFALANLFTAIVNLVPFKYQAGSDPVFSDGYSIIKTIFSKQAHIPDEMEQILFQASLAFYYKDFEACKTLSKKAIEKNKDDKRGYSYYAIAVSGLGDYKEGIKVLNKLLESPDLEDGTRAITQSNLAYYYLLLDDPSNYGKALELTEKAMEYGPWELSIRSNYGALNIVAGDVKKGIDVLTDKRYSIHSKEAQAEIHCFLAIGLAKINETELAKSDLTKARKLDSKCIFIPRAEKQLHNAEARAAGV